MAYDGECGIILRDRSGRSSCGSYRICCKQGLYENLLTSLLGRLALANVFTDITENSMWT